MDSLKELLKVLETLYPSTDFEALQTTSYLSDFGIDSIGIVQIVFKLEKQIGVSISLAQFSELELTYVEDLIVLIESLNSARFNLKEL